MWSWKPLLLEWICSILGATNLWCIWGTSLNYIQSRDSSFEALQIMESFSSVIFPDSFWSSMVVILLLPPKDLFSIWPWEQTSCLLCELRVNFSLPFDLGHFEYDLAWLIVCSSLSPLWSSCHFGWDYYYFGQVTLVSRAWMIPASNIVRHHWMFLPGQRNLTVNLFLAEFNFLFGFYYVYFCWPDFE